MLILGPIAIAELESRELKLPKEFFVGLLFLNLEPMDYEACIGLLSESSC